MADLADFFISYNSADEAKAEWIALTLREAGYSVRFAKWELTDGNIAAWMREALDNSDRLIAVSSPEYFDPKAAYSAMEREAFLWTSPKRFGGTIIPVVVRAVEIPKLYAPFMRVDLTGVGEAEAKQRLIGMISAHDAQQPAAPPAFTPEPAAQKAEPVASLLASPVFRQEPGGGAAVASSPLNNSYFGWPALIALSVLVYTVWRDQHEDGRVLPDLWQALTGVWLPGLLLVLYAVMYWLINAGLDAPGSRRAIVMALRLDRGGDLYRSVMRRVLDAIDRAFSREEQTRGLRAEHWNIAWSPRLFEGCLLIAIFYPLYSLFAIWAATNQPGIIGGVEIVPGGQDLFVRLATIGGLVSALSFAQLSQLRRSQGRVAEAHLYLGFAAFIVVFAVVFAVAVAFAAAAAFLVAIVAGIFFSRRPIGQWGRRCLGEFAVIATVSSLTAIAMQAAGLHTDANLWWQIVILFGYFYWFAKAADAALEFGPSRLGHRGLFYTGYALAIFALLVLLVQSALSVNEDFYTFLLFLGFLPLLNAVFDFGSLGLTRFCLRRGLKPGFLVSLRWSLIDALAAIVLFAGLVLAAILLVHWVRDGNGQPLADLNAIFRGIADEPNSYWWLYLTFFSTLIPTLLHLGVACFSFIALAPAPLQRTIAGWVSAMDSNGFANRGARYILPLIATLAIALPFLGLYTLGLWLADYHQNIGRGFFRLALTFAGWLDPAYVEGVAEILAAKG